MTLGTGEPVKDLMSRRNDLVCRGAPFSDCGERGGDKLEVAEHRRRGGNLATILVREDRPELRQVRTMEMWRKRLS